MPARPLRPRVTCASPTGPALKGAQISSGQRAAPAAIEHIRIKADKEPVFKVVGCDLWSDEVPDVSGYGSK